MTNTIRHLDLRSGRTNMVLILSGYWRVAMRTTCLFGFTLLYVELEVREKKRVCLEGYQQALSEASTQ